MTPIQKLIFEARYVAGYLSSPEGGYTEGALARLRERLTSAADAADRHLHTHLIDAYQSSPGVFVELWKNLEGGLIRFYAPGKSTPLALTNETQYPTFYEANRIFDQIKEHNNG